MNLRGYIHNPMQHSFLFLNALYNLLITIVNVIEIKIKHIILKEIKDEIFESSKNP